MCATRRFVPLSFGWFIAPARSTRQRSADLPLPAPLEVIRDRAVVALLSEPSIEAAARRAGVSAKTLRRWIDDDIAFQKDLEIARRSAFDAG